jgi:hypothetical protein
MEKQVLEELPDAKKAQTYGILSIVFGFCCNILGFPGIIFGYLGYSKAMSAIATYKQNPSKYTSDSDAQTGKITAIVGLIFGALGLIGTSLYIVMIVLAFSEGGENFDFQMLLENFMNNDITKSL